MLEPVTDTIFGNPVFAGLAAFSATSVTLAAVSWFASPVFGCSRRRAGWRGASGEIVLSGRLSRWSRTVLSERTTLSRKGPAQGREDPRGKEILPSIDFEALQRELDDAFAPVGRDRGKNLMSGPDIVRAFVGCLPPSECDDGGGLRPC
ncbi:hypothetical protein [Ensifer canadensis]